MIVGIDEVGRGPWAGPLVVGAVVLPDGFDLPGLTDSKKLSAKRRDVLAAQIKERASGWGLGWVHAAELDAVGLSKALRLATIRAMEAITVPYHEIIIDGTINFLQETGKGAYVTTLPKADALIPAVSAASIVAKVARDAYMAGLDVEYPGYGFGSHVGYGTAKHRQALDTLGITPQHRKSFKPIAAMIPASQAEVAVRSVLPTSTSIGHAFEVRVAEDLEKQGYIITHRNWKTRSCEIDIIAQKAATTYFVEAKYRQKDQQGDGFDAVGPKKQRQMAKAAKLFIAQNRVLGEVALMVAAQNDTGTIDYIALDA